MRVGHIELFVRDVATSRRFYVDVLGCRDVQPEATHVAWVALGEQEFLLRPGAPRPAAATYAQAEVGFVLYVDDLAAARKTLEGRGLVFRGTDGSDDCLTFQDPDGHWFQMVDPAGH